jgi:hypothetical protein
MQLYARLEKSRAAVDCEAENIASNYSAACALRTWTIGIGDVCKHGSGESYEVCFNLAASMSGLSMACTLVDSYHYYRHHLHSAQRLYQYRKLYKGRRKIGWL